MNTTPALTLVVTNDDPRILDTDLAIRLGMNPSRKVRQNLIEPNRKELEGLGELRMERIQTGGRLAKVFYLNEEQALLTAMFPRTEKATDVRREVIQVFMAYRRGQLELSAKGKVELPDFMDPGDAARGIHLTWADHLNRYLCSCVR